MSKADTALSGLIGPWWVISYTSGNYSAMHAYVVRGENMPRVGKNSNGHYFDADASECDGNHVVDGPICELSTALSALRLHTVAGETSGLRLPPFVPIYAHEPPEYQLKRSWHRMAFWRPGKEGSGPGEILPALNGEPVVFLAFQKGRPYSAAVVSIPDYETPEERSDLEEGGWAFAHWSVTWSKRVQNYCVYNHGCGGGPLHAEKWDGERFWAASGVQFKEGTDLRARIPRIPPRYQITKLFGDAWETDTVYCQECGDELPESDAGNPCRHIWWCEECGWWDTPSERCGHSQEETAEHHQEQGSGGRRGTA